jgi:iron complex outermembrane receptor protein
MPTATIVVIGGFSRSVETSISAKKNSDSVVEVVSAEDIGKLPDVSIAESLARLPGVAAQRVDGRAQVLSIRGMAPKFGVTLLNGREMVSTGDDRSFEYDQFPSELVTSAAIYKTPDASLGTQGLAGTVNMVTVHPLDFKERKVNLNVRMDKNSFGDLIPGSNSTGARVSASYIDQFANNTIGVALGFAHLDSPNQKKYFNPWDFGKASNLGVDGLGDAYAYMGLETGVASTQSQRDGLLAVLEYKPNKDFRSKIDLFSSSFNQKMNGRELIAYWANWANGTTPTFAALPDPTAGGSIGNLTPFVTQRKDNREDKVNAFGWNSELKIEKWTTMADLSYSRATRNEFKGEAYATGINPISMDVRIPSGFSSFGSLSSSFDFTNPANWQLSTPWWGGGAYGSDANVEDVMKSARLSAKRELDWGLVSGFNGGVIFSERSKDMNYVGTNYDLAQGTDCNMWPQCAPLPNGFLQSSAKYGFNGIPGMLSFDVMDAINSGAYVASPSDPKSPTWNWGVNEKITTAFAKFNLDLDTKIPVRGNFGVQVVSVKQNSTGLYRDENGDRTPVEDGAAYTDVLPSLNLVGELDKSTFLRFGAAKVVARPNLIDMRAGITASVSQTDRMWSGSGGNPQLEPWRATAYDLSLEKYFGKGTYAALAVFEKQVTTGIITKDIQWDFSKYPNPTAIVPVSNMGTLTAPANTNGGHVSGWELSGALEGSMLSNSLEGFGLIGSYSKTSSNLPGTDASGAPTSTKLEGLSGDVWGLTVYYEKNGFQARVAQRYRSEFTAARHNAFLFAMESIRSEKITDMQIGYEMQSGPYKGLGILFQVNNLTNTPYVATQTVDGITALSQYHEFGRQYLLGLNYKF